MPSKKGKKNEKQRGGEHKEAVLFEIVIGVRSLNKLVKIKVR